MNLKIYYVLRALVLILIAIALILYTGESLTAAKTGFKLWAEILFPSLLPFFIITDLLIAYGIINFLGIFLEPFARPLFNVKGVGGVVFFLAIAAGFPSGAKMSVQLYESGEITRDEAERMAAFCNFSSPLFILGAIGVGMFNNYKIGILLMIIHYISNIFVGITLGIISRRKKLVRSEEFTYKRNLWELFQNASSKNKKAFGAQFGESVSNSINTLINICGFVVIFSVLNSLLSSSGFIPLITKIINEIMHVSPTIFQVFLTGILEVTIGAKSLIESSNLDLFTKVFITSILLGFNGFSIHSQIASILNSAKLSYKPFFYARVLQSLYSAMIIIGFWELLIKDYLSLSTENVYQPLVNNSYTNTNLLLYGTIFTFTILFYYAYYNFRRIINKETYTNGT